MELVHEAVIINTKDLLEICDNVITGRGSIGLEFACAGKYPILAGSAAYSKIGFTLDPKNKKHYFNLIKKIGGVMSIFKLFACGAMPNFKKFACGAMQISKK